MSASTDFNDNARLNYGDTTAWDGATEITYSWWTRMESLANGQGWYGKSIDAGERCYCYLESHGWFFWNIESAAGRRAIKVANWSSVATVNVWEHYCVTWAANAGTNLVKFYFNGVDTAYDIYAGGNAGALPNTNNDLILGNLTPTGGWFIDGQMAYFRVHTRVLSQNEVYELMYQPDSIVDGLVIAPDLTNSSCKDPITGITPGKTNTSLSNYGPPVNYKKLMS